jgi:hypothetical protein
MPLNRATSRPRPTNKSRRRRLDRFDERHSAGGRDGKNGLVFHTGGRIEGFAGRLEFRHLTIGRELLIRSGRLGALRQRGCRRQLYDREQTSDRSAPIHVLLPMVLIV